MSKVPTWLVKHVGALLILCGMGAGGVGMGTAYLNDSAIEQAQQNEYVQAVASDPDTSMSVKLAMVLGSYYESSGKHIGVPYIDKLGKGQPLTVCNGITGAGVIAGKWYSPAACYQLEKGRYLAAERAAKRLFVRWARYDDFAKATFIDFIHNKGEASLGSSTLLRKANVGDLEGACRENPRWNMGTVNGVKKVLPGLQLRGDANDEICRLWRIPTPSIATGN